MAKLTAFEKRLQAAGVPLCNVPNDLIKPQYRGKLDMEAGGPFPIAD